MLKKLGGFYVRARMAIRGGIAGCALGVLSIAMAGGGSEYQAFMDLATGATKHTVGFGTTGTPLATAGTGGATGVGNMNFSHTSGGWPQAGGTSQVPSPLPGTKAPVGAKQAFTKASMGRALANFAKKGIPIISTGMAIKELIDELGLTHGEGPTGENVVYGAGTTMYPYYMRRDGSGNLEAQTQYPNAGQACSAQCNGQSIVNGKPYTCTATLGAVDLAWQPPGKGFQCTKSYVGLPYGDPPAPSPPVPEQLTSVTGEGDALGVTPGPPMTEQELADLIASKSGWPTGSAVSRALADAMNAPGTPALVPEGKTALSPQTQTVTGPKTTTTGSNGTKTETQTKCDLIVPIGSSTIEYQCATTSTQTSVTTTTVITTAPNGSTSTSSVTATMTTTFITTQANPDGSTAEESKEQCDESSNTVGCAKLDTPTGEVPKSNATIVFAPEDLGLGSGSCPSPVQWSAQHSGQSVTLNFSSYCEALTTWIKPVILALSAFAAIAICLGGLKD